VLAVIERLQAETTVFMSTHILSDVERVCDVVGIIDHGELITKARTEQLRERYARSVFEVQFEEDPTSLISTLNSLPWVVKVDVVRGNGEPILRVQAKDVDAAKHILPRLIAESELTLLRYELTLPSLEDIFIELVSSEGAK
jgi:ABC-2 type transport system ATP-binding protein